MNQNKGLSFSGQAIYIGLDVHKKTWKITVLTKDFEHKTFCQNPDSDLLARYLHRNFPGATYRCAYEAGYCGFWICDRLNELGIDCIVVNPADVPTKDKERKQKNDKRDSRKLAKSLRGGLLDPIYTPTAEQIADRQLIRTRHQIVKDQTRIKNQIKGLLAYNGIKIPENFDNSNWSFNFIKWLETLETERKTLKISLEFHIKRLKVNREMLTEITKKIRKLAASEKYREPFSYLFSFPGIGVLSAMVWLTELMDIDRFKNFDHLASFVGVIPGEHSSGDKESKAQITTRKNRFLRALIIENAWTAIRKDPALLMYYSHLTKGMKGNRAIIRVAKKLLRRIYYCLKYKRYYVMGTV